MPLSMSARRFLWSLTLVYAASSAAYAMAVLARMRQVAPTDDVPPVAFLVILGHILLFPFVREGWNRFSSARWEGLIRTSEVTRGVLKGAIRVFGGGLLVAGVLLVLAVRLLDFRLTTEGGSRLPVMGVAVFVLFGSVVYGACSLFGGDAVTSRDPGIWERLLMKIGRRLRDRGSGRR
jgi:hypothetical protein